MNVAISVPPTVRINALTLMNKAIFVSLEIPI